MLAVIKVENHAVFNVVRCRSLFPPKNNSLGCFLNGVTARENMTPPELQNPEQKLRVFH